MQPSRSWLIGVFLLCHATCKRKKSNASSLRVIRPRPLAGGIARFCCYSHAWDFERAILCSYVSRISIGKQLGRDVPTPHKHGRAHRYQSDQSYDCQRVLHLNSAIVQSTMNNVERRQDTSGSGTVLCHVLRSHRSRNKRVRHIRPIPIDLYQWTGCWRLAAACSYYCSRRQHQSAGSMGLRAGAARA